MPCAAAKKSHSDSQLDDFCLILTAAINIPIHFPHVRTGGWRFNNIDGKIWSRMTDNNNYKNDNFACLLFIYWILVLFGKWNTWMETSVCDSKKTYCLTASVTIVTRQTSLSSCTVFGSFGWKELIIYSGQENALTPLKFPLWMFI